MTKPQKRRNRKVLGKPGESVLFLATVVAESKGGVLVLVDGCPIFIPGKAIVEMDFKIVRRKNK